MSRDRISLAEAQRQINAAVRESSPKSRKGFFGWYNWYWNRGRCDKSNMHRWARQKSWRRVF